MVECTSSRFRLQNQHKNPIFDGARYTARPRHHKLVKADYRSCHISRYRLDPVPSPHQPSVLWSWDLRSVMSLFLFKKNTYVIIKAYFDRMYLSITSNMKLARYITLKVAKGPGRHYGMIIMKMMRFVFFEGPSSMDTIINNNKNNFVWERSRTMTDGFVGLRSTSWSCLIGYKWFWLIMNYAVGSVLVTQNVVVSCTWKKLLHCYNGKKKKNQEQSRIGLIGLRLSWVTQQHILSQAHYQQAHL